MATCCCHACGVELLHRCRASLTAKHVGVFLDSVDVVHSFRGRQHDYNLYYTFSSERRGKLVIIVIFAQHISAFLPPGVKKLHFFKILFKL